MKIIIDRIEGDYAVAEMPDGTALNIPKALFPNCCEGDAYTIEKDITKADAETKSLMKELFK